MVRIDGYEYFGQLVAGILYKGDILGMVKLDLCFFWIMVFSKLYRILLTI